MNYNLGLCSVSFRKHTPEEILRAMKDAGLSVIEWGSDVHCPPEKAEEFFFPCGIISVLLQILTA